MGTTTVELLEIIAKEVADVIGPDVSGEEFKSKWDTFCKVFNRYLKDHNGNLTILIRDCNKWLTQPIIFDRVYPKAKPGRKPLPFDCLTPEGKRLRVASLRDIASPEELRHATALETYNAGNRKESQRISTGSGAGEEGSEKVSKLTPEQGLELYVLGNFTRHQYGLMRKYFPMLPSYKKVQLAKKKCYPEGIIISDGGGSVPVKALLEHSTRRALESMDEEERSKLKDGQQILVRVKTGTDSAGGLPEFKQQGDIIGRDGTVLVSGMVLLQIEEKEEDKDQSSRRMTRGRAENPTEKPVEKEGDIIWKNETPSSAAWCRPIRFRYTKETDDAVLEEISYIKEQFEAIAASGSTVDVDGKTIFVEYKNHITMIDGKVVNIISECSSASRCNLCNLTSWSFNDREKVKEALKCVKKRVL